MDIATLKGFCSTKEHHLQYGINQPFTRGSWTYATDGCVCIRVPSVPEVKHEAKGSISRDAEKLFSDIEARNSIWQPLPTFELKYSDCPECKGHGYLKLCSRFNQPDDCTNGEGKLCREHSALCSKGCNADEESAFKCEDCEGKGTIKHPGMHIVQGSDGKTQISAIYLDMIKDLPNVMIAPYDETSAFPIRFDGGEGMLMPMKQ